MKKAILSVVLVLTLVLGSSSITAMAAAPVTAEAVYDAEQGAIIVSGIVQSERSGLYVTVEIQNEQGKTVYMDQLALPYHESSDKPYSFAPIVLHPKNVTGDYTISVTAEDIGAATPIEYPFVGADVQYGALKEVCEAIEAGSASALRQALLPNSEDLGISTTLFEAMGSDGQSSVLSIMLKKQYTVPENYDSDENIDVIMENVTKLRQDWLSAVTIGQYNEIANGADLKAWLESYGGAFAADDDQTPDVNEKLLYDYVLDVLNESAFVRRVTSGEVLYEMENICDTLYEEALLTVLEVRHYSEGRAVLEAFPTLFGLDLSAFSQLNASKQGEVYEEVKGSYTSLGAAGDAFDILVASKQASGSTGGSGSSGGRSSSTISAPILTEQAAGQGQTGQAGQSDALFPDMNQALWAEEAARALKEKGIISGDENGNLNPNNNITRAEFTKLVVLATGLTPDWEDAGFADVSSSDWYFSYVNAAKKDGLVVGDALNCFNPNALITREDMSVILYRAYRINEDLGYSLDFADADSVSDYAQNAVAFLAAKDVIRGVGDNLFAPKNMATRAQAIQMIYNALAQIG